MGTVGIIHCTKLQIMHIMRAMLAVKNVSDLGKHLSSVREESATAQMNLKQISENANDQFKKLNEQDEYGETRRQTLERKIEELSKGISEKTSFPMGAKRQTTDL